MIPRGKTTDISMLSQPPINSVFSANGPKRAVFWVLWNAHFLMLTQKERCARRAECTQVTLFPHDCWFFEAKMRFRPVSGVPGKRPKATGRNYAAGPFMQEFWKTPLGGTTKISVASSPYPVFHVGGPKRALLALSWAPGGPGPIQNILCFDDDRPRAL